MIQKLSNPQTPGTPAGFLKDCAALPQQDLPTCDFQLRLVERWQDLLPLVPAWRRLVETSLEPNVFYEPQFMLPAMEHLAGQDVRVLVIESAVRVCPDDRRVLCGLFPLRASRSMRGLPFSTLEMWCHDYCFLTTPLVRHDVADEVIQAFLEWQQKQPQRLLHIPLLAAGGPVEKRITENLRRLGTMKVVRDSHDRATVIRRESTSQVLGQGLSRKRRHELRRTRKKLEQLGQVNIDVYDSTQDPVPWLEQFLAVEAGGWKGREQSAIHQNVSDRNFFESMIQLTAAAGKLSMIRLQLDRQTIAMKINLLSEHGAFCFKITYDERFARFSPGVLLEVENLEWMHGLESAVEWMDSCAQPDHPMIDNVWPDSRKIESVVIPSKRRFATLAAASIPFCRTLKIALSKTTRGLLRRPPFKTPFKKFTRPVTGATQ